MTAWQIDFADGTTKEVQTVVGDVCAFETDRKKKLDATSLADLTWLVWRASTRLKQTKLPFQAWADTVNDFNPVSADPLEQPE